MAEEGGGAVLPRRVLVPSVVGSAIGTFRSFSLRWQLALGGLLAYSALHFFYSGVLWSAKTLGGGLLSTFPGPLMYRAARVWPAVQQPWLMTDNPAKFQMWHDGPMLHFLTFPFIVAGSLRRATLIILGINYAIVGWTFVWWYRLLKGDEPHRTTLLLVGLSALWLNYQPLLEGIAGRECELWELALMTGSLGALRARRERLAGVLAGVATMIKFIPLALIPYYFIKGFRRAGWAAVVTVLVISLAALPLFDAQHSILLYWLAGEGQGKIFFSDYDTQAILNMLYKMFTPFNLHELHPAALLGPVLYPIGMLMNLTVTLGCAWFVWRWRRTPWLEVECALLASAVLLILPHTSPYYLVFMLPALSTALAVWVHQPEALRPVVKGALIGSIVLSGFMIPMTVVEKLSGMPAVVVSRALWMYSLPGVGMILGCAVMLEIHRLLRTGRLTALSQQLEGRRP